MLVCYLPTGKEKIVFTDEVISLWMKYRQKNYLNSEAGGQLFAKIKPGMVTVTTATPPYTKDRRGRFQFIPDKRKARKDIQQYFKKGLHYVGDWHTHPESSPSPSTKDIRSMRGCFSKSTHELNFFILVIIGKTPVLGKIWVGLVNKDKTIILSKKIVICNSKNF